MRRISKTTCALKPIFAIPQQRLKVINHVEGAFYKQHFSSINQNFLGSHLPKPSLLQNKQILDISNNITRSVTKYSMRNGKRKTVNTVLFRFYRLNWGAWIRTKAGRHKHLWKKSPPRKRRLRQHVFCNATQSKLLDKMAGSFWRKPKYFVDDPYEPYHSREEFWITARKPKPYFPPN